MPHILIIAIVAALFVLPIYIGVPHALWASALPVLGVLLAAKLTATFIARRLLAGEEDMSPAAR